MKTNIRIIIGVAVILGALLTGSCGDLLLPKVTSESAPTLAQKVRGIWMVGGISASTIGSAVGHVDVYDPVAQTWYDTVTSLPTPVSFAGAVGYKRPLDGHHLIVVLGGFDSGGAVQNLVQIYDVEDDSWSAGTPMPSARANIYATQVYDKVYILAGSTSAAVTSTSIQEYTIGSTWTTLSSLLITTSSERFTFGYDDIVYNIGGRSTATAPVAAGNSFDGYSIGGKGVTGAAEIPYAQPLGNAIRTGVAGALWRPVSLPSAAQIILIGGITTNPLVGTTGNFIANGTTSGAATNIVYYLFFPFTSPQPIPPAGSATVWSAGAFYPGNISFGSAVVIGNTLFHFGGTSNVVSTTASGQAAAYKTDLTALPGNTWTSITNMPVGRWGHTAVTFPQ